MSPIFFWVANSSRFRSITIPNRKVNKTREISGNSSTTNPLINEEKSDDCLLSAIRWNGKRFRVKNRHSCVCLPGNMCRGWRSDKARFRWFWFLLNNAVIYTESTLSSKLYFVVTLIEFHTITWTRHGILAQKNRIIFKIHCIPGC